MSRRKKRNGLTVSNPQLEQVGDGAEVLGPDVAIDTKALYTIGPPPPPPEPLGLAAAPKKTLNIDVGGANRGALAMLSAIASYNSSSSGMVLRPRYIDPLPGRANALKEEAARLGVEADAVEGRVEVVVRASESTGPMTLTIDRAAAVAHAIRETENAGRTTLWYILLRLRADQLWAIRGVIPPEDLRARRATVALCETIGKVSERGGSDAIFGTGASPGNLLAEPMIREWFARHYTENLAKASAGVEPNSAPLEVTQNGVDTLPLHVVETSSWNEPRVLAEQVLQSPAFPIKRGTQFIVAEVNDAEPAVRFHTVRRRSDDRVSVGGADVISDASLAALKTSDASALAVVKAAEDRRLQVGAEEQRRMVLASLAKAMRETVTTVNPVATTD